VPSSCGNPVPVAVSPSSRQIFPAVRPAAQCAPSCPDAAAWITAQQALIVRAAGTGQALLLPVVVATGRKPAGSGHNFRRIRKTHRGKTLDHLITSEDDPCKTAAASPQKKSRSLVNRPTPRLEPRQIPRHAGFPVPQRPAVPSHIRPCKRAYQRFKALCADWQGGVSGRWTPRAGVRHTTCWRGKAWSHSDLTRNRVSKP